MRSCDLAARVAQMAGFLTDKMFKANKFFVSSVIISSRAPRTGLPGPPGGAAASADPRRTPALAARLPSAEGRTRVRQRPAAHGTMRKGVIKLVQKRPGSRWRGAVARVALGARADASGMWHRAQHTVEHHIDTTQPVDRTHKKRLLLGRLVLRARFRLPGCRPGCRLKRARVAAVLSSIFFCADLRKFHGRYFSSIIENIYWCLVLSLLSAEKGSPYVCMCFPS